MSAAKQVLQRIGRTFEVAHGYFEVVGHRVLGQWGVDAFNGLKHVHSCAEATIQSKGDIVFPYNLICISPKLKVARKAIRALKPLNQFFETRIKKTIGEDVS